MIGMKIFNLVAENKASLLTFFPWISLLVILFGVRIFFDKATHPFKQIHIRSLGVLIVLSAAFFWIKNLATWGVFLVFCFYTAAFIMTMKPKKETEPPLSKIRPAFFSLCLLGAVGVTAGMSSGYAPSISMGPSMWPAAPKRVNINFLNTKAFRSERPSYGDDIEFEVPKGKSWPQGRYRKRVWGVPGDKILVEEYGIVVNGKRFADCSGKSELIVQKIPQVWFCHAQFPKLSESQLFVWGDMNPLMYKSFREIVKSGQLFVMGDNTVESSDSREMGPIDASWVVGRYENQGQTKEKWSSW